MTIYWGVTENWQETVILGGTKLATLGKLAIRLAIDKIGP